MSRYQGADMEERFGFTAELDTFRLDLILADGLQAGMINVNALGFAEYGVYVCQHLDVTLRYSTLKCHDSETVYVVVYKVCDSYTVHILQRVDRAAANDEIA